LIRPFHGAIALLATPGVAVNRQRSRLARRAPRRDDCCDSERRQFDINRLRSPADGYGADDGATDHDRQAPAPAEVPLIAIVGNIEARFGVAHGAADLK
jgi:hypothetical protein